MVETKAIGKLPRKDTQGLKSVMRDRFRKARPYIVGTVSTATVAGLELLLATKVGGPTTDFAINMALFSTTIGAKAFKDAQREARKLTNLEKLEKNKIRLSIQTRVSEDGTFAQKSALLNNPHIDPMVLETLKEDTGFRDDVLRNLDHAIKDLRWCENVILLAPQSKSYYKEIIRTIRAKMAAYEKNLDVLDTDTMVTHSIRPAVVITEETAVLVESAQLPLIPVVP
ncbi:MAG: hypothetical protein KGH64_01275 [Candidatus Micrarchaeota archaeon]|nr:hypothetical protein [Candidatus Micrarchaeota archaeon]MDE1833949.1 hypothetical protein [Candidatus Micrarchaeota archaeon]MDE1859825.1 hypothetical protein [Candidatus Micrarchaeota archaeon]